MPDISTLFQIGLNGLFLGGVYGLIAIGLTMIYGVMKVTNFAHGELVMMGMYVAFWAYTLLGLDPLIGTFLVAGVMFLLGALIQHFLMSRVLDAEPMNQIMLTMGISTVLWSSALMFWGANVRRVVVPYSASSLIVGGVIFNLPRTIAFVVAMLLALGLFAFLKYSRTGKAMRAASQDRKAAQLMGINVKFIYMLAFGIGTALAGIAGSLITPFQSIYPTAGQAFAVLAFVIVVLGTMGNFLGALLGGLIIGMTESVSGYFIGPQSKMLVALLIFAAVLMFKPSGLFGDKKL